MSRSWNLQLPNVHDNGGSSRPTPREQVEEIRKHYHISTGLSTGMPKHQTTYRQSLNRYDMQYGATQRISEELDARTVDVGIGDISRSDVSAQGSVDIGGQVLGGYDHSLGFQSHYATGSTASSFNMRPENSREFSSFHMDTSSTAFGKLDGNICSPSRLAMDSYTGAGNFPPIPLTQTVGNRDYDFLQKLPLYNNQSTSYGCNQLLSFSNSPEQDPFLQQTTVRESPNLSLQSPRNPHAGPSITDPYAQPRNYTLPPLPPIRTPPRCTSYPYSPPKTPVSSSSTTPRPFACTVTNCAATFTRKADRKRHVDSVHGHNSIYRCPDCQQTFNRKDNLKSHAKNFHSEENVNESEAKKVIRTAWES